MKKYLPYIVSFVVIIGVFLWEIFQPVQKVYLPGTNEQYCKIVPLSIPDTLSFAGEKVPLDMFYVKEALDKELAVNTYWHSSTLQLIRKSHRWFPLIDSVLRANRIPVDFRYIPLIESNLSNVKSPAGAVGFWQLMKGTAKDYGLEVSKEVDERYDVKKSAEAASRYLLKSYEKLHNWTLVAAAYNAGNRRITSLMETQKANNFYDLLVPEETGRYIFRILAVKLIFSHPEDYGFYLQKSDYYEPLPYYVVEINHRVDSWADFSKEHRITYRLLKYYNPWLRQPYLKNRKKKTYKIKIPEEPYNLTNSKLSKD